MLSKVHLAGSVDYYIRQIFVGTEMTNWPSKIETATSDQLPGCHVLQLWKNQVPETIKLHACNAKRNSVFVFPEAIYYEHIAASITTSSFESFLTEAPCKTLNGVLLPRDHYYIFVCTHGERDQRCGQRGPAIAAAIQKRAIDRVHVFQCSHVGGHKYAGNVIVYGLRYHPTVENSEMLFYSGDWYGLIEEHDVDRLLNIIVVQKTIWKEKWRGSMGTSKDQQEQMAVEWGLCRKNECAYSCQEGVDKLW
jgi:hypothetical protein